MNIHAFALCFKGSAAPRAGESGMIDVESRTQATMLTTGFKTEGVASDRVSKGDGQEAVFRSTVRMLNESEFDEDGSIDYGHGNTITFATPNRGWIGPSPMPGVQSGAVIWRVTGGTGVYLKATGHITSNFTLHSDGVVVDHQFAVVFTE